MWAWLQARFGKKPLGQQGERAAARHLRRRGYRILGMNVRSRLGEIDILAVHRASRTVCVVEVKTTVSDDPPPEVHVNAAKQRKLTLLADQLVKRYRLQDRVIRFDVVGVVWPTGEKQPRRITHHEGAFEAQW